MKIFKQLFKRNPAQKPLRLLWQFIDNRNQLRELCESFPATDALYFETLFTGGFAIFDGALRFFSVIKKIP